MTGLLVRLFERLLLLGTLAMGTAGILAAPSRDPEAEYRALLVLSRAQLPAVLRSDEVAKVAWMRQNRTELHDRGGAFLTLHAAHPLRWDVLVLLRYGGEEREKVSRSGFRQLVPVPESKAAWDRKYFPGLEALLAAPDASPNARGEALRQLIDHTARGALALPAEARQIIPRVRGWLDQHEREFPRSRYSVWLYHLHANLLDAAAPDLCVAFLAELERRYQGSDFLDRQVREEVVAGHRRALEAQARPMDELWSLLREMDPVVGDGARYRGKVVLVAFGPVTYVTLMEGLEDLHAKYYEDGLVILQIASFSRNYGLPPEPQQRRDLEKVLAVRKWPWPVLWNPQGHLDLVRQWGFNTIPARMLIGRDGRLVPDRYTPHAVSIPRELARTAAPDPAGR